MKHQKNRINLINITHS